MLKKAVAVVAVAAFIAPAIADDLNPPPWDREDPRATFQEWTFDAPSPDINMIFPDVVDNPFGDPVIIDEYYYPDNAGSSKWLDTYEGRDGVYMPYWYFYMDLPNDPVERELKDIYVQLTWHPSGEVPIVDVFWPEAPYTNEVNLDMRYELPDGWMYDLWHIQIWPNPDFETLYFDITEWDMMYIDQIVVDTICIPAPGSFALLGLAGLAIRRRR